MKTRDDVISVIQTFAGNTNVVAIPRALLAFFKGDYPVAVVASQLIYWQGKQAREDGYIFKSYLEWQEETALSQYQVSRAVKKLGKFVKTKLLKAGGSPTLHYYFDMFEFKKAFIKFLNNPLLSFSIIHYAVSQQSLHTENTTYNTTKITNKNNGKNGKKRNGLSATALKTDNAFALSTIHLFFKTYKQRMNHPHPNVYEADILSTCNSLIYGVHCTLT